MTCDSSCGVNRKAAKKRTAALPAGLFTSFFRIGAFTFGSGFAMLPMVRRTFTAERYGMEDCDISDTFALAQSLPGSIAVNTAAMIGHRTAGKAGAFFAAAGVVLPSFLIIFALSFFLDRIGHLQAVRYAFAGVRAGVLALIIKAMLEMAKQCTRNRLFWVIAASAFAAVVFFGVHVFTVIVCSAAAGTAAAFLPPRKETRP